MGLIKALLSQYTFTNISKNHTIEVFYRLKRFTVNVSVSGQGKAFPASAELEIGSDHVLILKPKRAHKVSWFSINEGEQTYEPPVQMRTIVLRDIQADVNIDVEFAKAETQYWFSAYNGNGKLDLGDDVNRPIVENQKIFDNESIRLLSKSADFSVIQTNDVIWLLGKNDLDQLGNLAANSQEVDWLQNVEAKSPGTIEDIAVGETHSLILVDGQVYELGDSHFMQVNPSDITASSSGFGTPLDSSVMAISADSNQSFWIKKKSLHAIGLNSSDYDLGIASQDNTNSIETIVDLSETSSTMNLLASGNEHTIYTVIDNGVERIYGFGRNSEGQLGLGHTDPVSVPEELFSFTHPQNNQARIIKIYAGLKSTFVLYDDGVVMASGMNIGEGLNNTIFAICLNDTLYYDENLSDEDKIYVTDISAGYEHSLILADIYKYRDNHQ